MSDEHTLPKSDIELLNDIMAGLPDPSEHTDERRRYSLTKDDVIIIFRIAKIASGHVCPFDGLEDGESEIIQTMARSVNRTQKIASIVLITALVTSTVSGIAYAIKVVFTDIIKIGTK